MLFKEASGESLRGKRAVLDTVYARMLENGLTACTTLTEHHQYSWVSRRTKWVASESELQEFYKVESLDRVLDDRYKWFFVERIRPGWSRAMSCKDIGKHKFCRNK